MNGGGSSGEDKKPSVRKLIKPFPYGYSKTLVAGQMLTPSIVLFSLIICLYCFLYTDTQTVSILKSKMLLVLIDYSLIYLAKHESLLHVYFSYMFFHISQLFE